MSLTTAVSLFAKVELGAVNVTWCELINEQCALSGIYSYRRDAVTCEMSQFMPDPATNLVLGLYQFTTLQ